MFNHISKQYKCYHNIITNKLYKWGQTNKKPNKKTHKQANKQKTNTKTEQTRWFSNHESRLLSRSHAFAIIVILDLKIHESMWIPWLFFQKLEPKVIDPKMTFDPSLLRSHVWFCLRIIVSKSHENTSKYVDTLTLFFQKLEPKVIDP